MQNWLGQKLLVGFFKDLIMSKNNLDLTETKSDEMILLTENSTIRETHNNTTGGQNPQNGRASGDGPAPTTGDLKSHKTRGEETNAGGGELKVKLKM